MLLRWRRHVLLRRRGKCPPAPPMHPGLRPFARCPKRARIPAVAWLSAAPDGDAGRVRAALELGGATPSLDEADLRDLVDYLGTPCRCGAFFSAGALERIGRDLGVPRGFGTRKRLLHQLLIQGSRLDRLPAVLDAFSALVDAHRRRLVGPPWAGQPSAAVWGERLEATGALLGEMRTSFLAEKAAQEASP